MSINQKSGRQMGGRRSVEELYQALFLVSPFRRNVSPSETKIEPDRRLSCLVFVMFPYPLLGLLAVRLNELETALVYNNKV